jgi:hypothetical protein
LDLVPTHADAGDDALIKLCVIAFSAAALWADGGKVEFQKRAGNLNITLFSTPSPVRVGAADLSVMVQKVGDQTPVLDAAVMIHLAKQDKQNITEVVAPASHAKATNKMLYAASMNVPSAGVWRAEVDVRQASEDAMVTGDINVLPPEPPLLTYWPYFALVPLVLLLFVFNRWLRRRRNALTAAART